MREVYVEGMEHPVNIEAYTIPDASRALGRSDLTVKRWIEDDLIPGPVLKDTVRGYRVYSAGELRAIADVLRRHEVTFSYYATAHTTTREHMMQALHAYRARHI
jgi:hypothetical protein